MSIFKKVAWVLVLVCITALSTVASADGGTFIDPMPPFSSASEIVPYGAGGNDYTENVGGGTWNHGTTFILPNAKQAYSNYYHATEYHRSSCRVGEKYNYSPYVSGRNTSYSQVMGLATDSSQAWWSKKPIYSDPIN